MTTIPTTPAVRRFNLAVEHADRLLLGAGDRLDLLQLIDALRTRNFWNAECGRIALELTESAIALADRGVWPEMPHLEPITTLLAPAPGNAGGKA